MPHRSEAASRPAPPPQVDVPQQEHSGWPTLTARSNVPYANTACASYLSSIAPVGSANTPPLRPPIPRYAPSAALGFRHVAEFGMTGPRSGSCRGAGQAAVGYRYGSEQPAGSGAIVAEKRALLTLTRPARAPGLTTTTPSRKRGRTRENSRKHLTLKTKDGTGRRRT